MSTVVIIEDVLSPPSDWKWVQTDNVPGTLLEHFGTWPQNARLYLGDVAQCNDVTPHDVETVAALWNTEGTFYAVVYPKDPASWVIAIAVIITAIVAAIFLFKPKVPPIPTMRNTQNTSPNNELSARENGPRPNGRIPDIFGTVRSTPDMICVPYNQYINHQEVEDCVMCIGRGQYEVLDMKDGETSVSEIDGVTVQVYRPNTNIYTGQPYFTVGAALTERPVVASRSNSVNGQVLGAPNSSKFRDTVRFRYPNIVQSEGGTFDGVFAAGDNIVVEEAIKYEETPVNGLIYPYNSTSFLLPFTDNDQIALYNSSKYVAMPTAVFSGPGGTDPETGESTDVGYNLSGTYPISSAAKISITTSGGLWSPPVTLDYCQVVLNDPASINATWGYVRNNIRGAYVNHTLLGDIIYQLDGAYTVLGVSGSQMVISDPAAVNPDWDKLQDVSGKQSDQLTPLIYATGAKWIGPFILESTTRTQIWCNFVASNGLYKDNGRKTYTVNVEVEAEVTPVDIHNQPTGETKTYKTTVSGSKRDKNTRARTLKITTEFTGRCSISVRRITASDLDFEGAVIDEVRWKDLYAMSPLSNANFGNVTMVRSRTYATTGALSLKARKLNCLVTRQLPRRISGSNFTTELYSTNSAADILSFVCLDKYIGNRSKAEVDFDNIYGTVAEVEQYFGTPLATEFCYTIDSDNLSFEETASIIATAVFCVAYRRGNIIRLFFERKTDRSSLLFNHRNKLPGTELRSITFGFDDHDGVEYEYVSPDDDAIVTMYKPDGGNAVNPEKYESIGIRNKVQAYLHTCRLWNKMQYRTTSIEFDATQEANLLLVGERILVADNTQANTQDGEVARQAGLVVYTSQSVSFNSDAKYYAFFQLPDGSVESIRVYAGPEAQSMRLDKAPRLPLVVDDGAYARATYVVAVEGYMDATPFLVTERDMKDNMTVTLQAVNYDDRYYENDTDFINGLVAA